MTTRSEYQDDVREKKPFVNNAVYTGLRRGVEYVFPAFITLYFAIAEVWQWANTAEIMATLSAVNIFLGVLVGLSRKRYEETDAKYDGDMVVNTTDPMKDNVVLDLSKTPDALINQKQVLFRVVNES